jgi:hypothetical protein
MDNSMGEKEFFDVIKDLNNKLDNRQRWAIAQYVNKVLLAYKPYSDINNIVNDMLSTNSVPTVKEDK